MTEEEIKQLLKSNLSKELADVVIKYIDQNNSLFNDLNKRLVNVQCELRELKGAI